MNTLKIKTTISCNTCGAPMKRVKSIKVNAQTAEAATIEAQSKAEKWKESLKNQNCKVCASILKDMAA